MPAVVNKAHSAIPSPARPKRKAHITFGLCRQAPCNSPWSELYVRIGGFPAQSLIQRHARDEPNPIEEYGEALQHLINFFGYESFMSPVGDVQKNRVLMWHSKHGRSVAQVHRANVRPPSSMLSIMVSIVGGALRIAKRTPKVLIGAKIRRKSSHLIV